MQGLGWAGGKHKPGIRQFDLEPVFVLWVKGVDSGWVQNSTLGTEDALSVVSQIAVRVDVAIEGNGPHA